MTILRDILDGAKTVTSTIKGLKIKTPNQSVAKQASNGVLQFPVLASTALGINEQRLVTKAIERECVSFVAVMTSINSVTDAKDIKEYLGAFHQNYDNTLKNAAGEIMVNKLREAFEIPTTNYSELQNIKLSEATAKLLLKNTKDENDNLLFNEETDVFLNYSDLNESERMTTNAIILEACSKRKNEGCGDKTCKNNDEYTEVCDTEACEKKASKFKSSQGVDSIVLKEDGNYSNHIFLIRNIENDDLRLVETAYFPVETISESFTSIKSNIKALSDSLLETYESPYNESVLNEATIRNDNFAYVGTGYVKDKLTGKLSETSKLSEANEEAVSKLSSQSKVSNAEIKKTNEIAPTLLNITTYFKDDNGGLHGVDYIIGVKAVLHPISTDSMMENLVNVFKRGKAFHNTMKLTTGEISFVKDYLFAVDRIKKDVNTKFRDNGWWNRLLRSKKENAMLIAMSKGTKQLPPNASIVISEDEVERIKIDHNIDLDLEKNVLDVMNKLHLLGFVIVDPSTETVKMITDNKTSFSLYTFADLEVKDKDSSREIKNIMQVLGRM